ncbi:MAG TPA: hypothetical protein QF851_05200 [Flavobacteriales bacterium]|nr:hypothetical protein [Flavobacteriales bacterium]
MITEKDIEQFQKRWGDGIIKISKMFLDKEDYISETKQFISDLYSYDLEKVLFKPTLASENQFRLDEESALSYFIGNNPEFIEDSGFAIKGWTNVRWSNAGIQLHENLAVSMGNYYFTNEDGELKVEFSIVYKKDIENNLKIILHDSHLPYQK